MSDRGLSKLQKNILRWLCEETVWRESRVGGFGRETLAIWGVPWHPRGDAKRWTPTARADVSRALRRLEERGLVMRQNQSAGSVPDVTPDGEPSMRARLALTEPAPKRTTHVVLLDAGRAIAERLT